MPKKVYDELLEKKTTPTVGDIHRLLKTVGKKGEKRDEKKQLVEQLFKELGVNATNIQGYHVVESLDAYESY